MLGNKQWGGGIYSGKKIPLVRAVLEKGLVGHFRATRWTLWSDY